MIIIRKARPEDARRLCELGNDLLKHLERSSPLLKLETLTTSRSAVKSWKEGIEKPCKGFFTFVAQSDNEVIGYMELMIKDNEPKRFFKVKRYGTIEAMLIDKRYRKQRVGKQMCEYAIDLFRKKKISYVRLNVFLKNTVGQAFWKKNGFAEESVDMIKKL